MAACIHYCQCVAARVSYCQCMAAHAYLCQHMAVHAYHCQCMAACAYGQRAVEPSFKERHESDCVSVQMVVVRASKEWLCWQISVCAVAWLYGGLVSDRCSPPLIPDEFLGT